MFFGRIAGISDVIGFHGDSVAELKKAFHEAVDHYLETCRKIGKEPQRPSSGKKMFRVAPEVHRILPTIRIVLNRTASFAASIPTRVRILSCHATPRSYASL